MDQTILITLTGIIVTGIGAQWLAWRLKVPAILFLLGIGLFLGPMTGLLNPNALLGDLLFPLVSLAVAVILFEGALTLRFKELKGVGSAVWLLVTLGAFVTWVIASYAAYYFVGLEPLVAALFGAAGAMALNELFYLDQALSITEKIEEPIIFTQETNS